MKEPLTERPGEPGPRASQEHLWALVGGPLIWAVHFLACYLTAAIWCAKVVGPEGPVTTVRWLVGAYTVAALIGIGASGLDALRRHRFGRALVPHDYDTAADRHRFLGFATLLLAALSAVAVLYVAAVIVFIGSCR
jgi:hypothetical protein